MKSNRNGEINSDKQVSRNLGISDAWSTKEVENPERNEKFTCLHKRGERDIIKTASRTLRWYSLRARTITENHELL